MKLWAEVFLPSLNLTACTVLTRGRYLYSAFYKFTLIGVRHWHWCFAVWCSVNLPILAERYRLYSVDCWVFEGAYLLNW